MKYGLLRECQSEFNTPTLLAKKPHFQEYRLVQDSRIIKQLNMDIHSIMPNSRSHKHGVDEENLVPQPAGRDFFDAAQGMAGVLDCKHRLPGHVMLLHQNFKSLSSGLLLIYSWHSLYLFLELCQSIVRSILLNSSEFKLDTPKLINITVFSFSYSLFFHFHLFC